MSERRAHAGTCTQLDPSWTSTFFKLNLKAKARVCLHGNNLELFCYSETKLNGLDQEHVVSIGSEANLWVFIPGYLAAIREHRILTLVGARKPLQDPCGKTENTFSNDPPVQICAGA